MLAIKPWVGGKDFGVELGEDAQGKAAEHGNAPSKRLGACWATGAYVP